VRPSERLTFSAAFVLAIITLWVRPEGGLMRLVIFVAIAAATLLLAQEPRDGGNFLRDWLPVGGVLAVFLLLQPIIEAAVPWRLDSMLVAFDARYLSWLVTAWRGAFGRPAAFTDAIYLAYVSYYLLPIAVAAVAWRRDAETFERTVFALLLGFYLTFLGYLLLPASGPRLPAADEAGRLGGGAISDAVRAFLHTAESTTLDAFPSGHTAIAVISGVFGSRLRGRGAATAFWAWGAAIVFATVYISVHYAVDVVAGLALAALVLAICPRPARSCASGARAEAGTG